MASVGVGQQVVSSSAPPASASTAGKDPQFQSRSPRYKIAPGDAFAPDGCLFVFVQQKVCCHKEVITNLIITGVDID